MRITDKLQDKFYQIADERAPAERIEINFVMRVMDRIGDNCSPDHYDEVLAREIRTQLQSGMVRAPRWVAWMSEITAAVEANKDAAQDLRGYNRNTHHIG